VLSLEAGGGGFEMRSGPKGSKPKKIIKRLKNIDHGGGHGEKYHGIVKQNLLIRAPYRENGGLGDGLIKERGLSSDARDGGWNEGGRGGRARLSGLRS